ncbi:MAG: amino acid adenylation domain-containing protein, partial [Ktedonobacteraceae bacterium]
ALDPSLCRRWLTLYPHIPLLNAYGPTECSDNVTHFPIFHLPATEMIHTPIGRPLANTQVYVLGKRLESLPIGVYGELYIGGIGVGRGYLYEPLRTAESFIPDPFSSQPGARLYKTGDLVRYLPDGNIEYSGRIDHQVKIRGLRIELGEIEATLQGHPALSAAVVLAREDLPGDKRLVAYLTLMPDSYVSPDELRHFLQERLPAFMLPSTYMYLESLPLLSSGKINRRALPVPEQMAFEAATDVAVTFNPVTELVSGIWTRVLKREQIGLHDDFFVLGGHSLLAVQVVSRVSTTFGVELPLQAFFLNATVSAQAEYIHQALQGTDADLVPPLVVVEHDRPLPLSFTQQRQWFLDQLDPESQLSTLFGAVRLNGHLDRSVLEQSLREIVRRHALLRTVFRMQDENLVQIIKPDITLPFNVQDLRTVPTEMQEAEVIRRATREQQWRFDLAQGPLLRITVAYLGAEEHVLMLTCHHILLDGWSMEVFLNELATLYVAFAQGVPSPLPELPVQYADYACWQRELLQGTRLERLLAYWKQRLSALPVLTLPTAHMRSPHTTYQAASLPLYVPKALTENLKALSHREGVTLYMILLTAFQTTLARYSGQHDIVVGSPTANRNRTELESVLGNFLNTLVLRTDLSGNPTFHEALQRVREVALGAYAHQDLPFEKLIQELHPERDPNRNPLFQVLFAFQNIPEQRISLPGLTSDFFTFGQETTIFDLDLTMWESEGELVGGLKYNTDLFDEALIRQMRDDLLALLDLMVTDVHLRIADRSLLADDEQARLRNSWNATNQDYNRQVTLHQLFEHQVECAPDALAVVFADQELTYQELNQQANQLAHHLRFLRVGSGSMVVVLLERSLEMIPAVLAVLKAGGCYVPLEPSFPEAHIRWILSTLDISIVITQNSCLPLLAKLSDLPTLKHVICLDNTSMPEIQNDMFPTPMQVWTLQSLVHYASTNVPANISSNALAYVIFTSGSTGTPKGVMVRHQPVVNLIEWVNRTFAINASDRVLFVTSLCFDLSVYDIFGLLAAGGTIQVVASADLHDPERLLDILLTTPVTFWDSAPAMLQMLPLATREPALENRSSLRLMFLSGDWIPIKLPAQVRAAFPSAEVVSLGGATEATVWSNFFRIKEVALEWASIPYGRPIQNASYYILDTYLNPRPLGVPGDLYISGECLATGYIGEPELTAQKFLPSPFSEQPGMRLYKTGDLARYWPDGTIEFLGRSDTQVKIRGFRVELGEIEATLTRHPGVLVAVADAHRDISGEKSLVAYVVPRQEQLPALTELRSYLQARLPAYMLPSNFVFLAALPMTANGKVDRRRLPELAEHMSLHVEGSCVAPSTPTEEQMAAIWIDALKLARLSIHDDFFLIGGHSLLAVQLITRIRSAWQIALPLRDLFAYSTVAGLSERVDAVVQAQQAGEMLNEPDVLAYPWYEDAVLDPDFPPAIVYAEQGQQLQQIFLTNATGLLGSALLVELLQKTDAQISCLVRGRDEADGRQRIKQALQQDYLWRDEFSSRIVPVCGDLAQPLLGLSAAHFERLALEIDSIYHNGAFFSHILPYEEHKAVNVLGTRMILRLAYTGRVKPIHYISTLGVLSQMTISPGASLMETDVLERDRDFMSSGYDQSKWCAEKIMRLACERGMPVTIYRPGRLTGHSQTGAWRTNDLVCRQIKGCIQLGGVPLEIFQDQMEMIPVDYSSQALVAISLQRHAPGKIFHLLNKAANIDVEHLVVWINDFGYPVEQQSYEVWRNALQHAAEEKAGNVLAPFLATYPEPSRAETQQQIAVLRTIYDDQQTQAALAGTSVSCPPIDKQLIHSYLSYFVKSGFLPAP